MQMLLRQTDPLTFRPRPVVSSSSCQLSGPAHWSSNYEILTQTQGLIQLTIAVELAGAVYGQNVLAIRPFVWAELSPLALVGQMGALLVSEWVVVSATSLGLADVLDLVTVVRRRAFAPELKGALL